MIDTLLGKIAGFFEKDFLFSSFLPALIFLVSLFMTGALTVGIEAVWVWIDSRTTTQTAAIISAATLLVVVVAYVLHALRGTFTRVWSGNSGFFLLLGWRTLGEFIQRRRFLRLRKNAERFSTWPVLEEKFANDVDTVYSSELPAPSPEQLKSLLKTASRIRQTKYQQVTESLLRDLVTAYGRYSGETLGDVYDEAKRALIDHDEEEREQIQSDASSLDRQFGSLHSVKATGLGNIIESYQQYPAKRYKLESEIFWPRLRKVVPSEYLSTVQEPRILLDFALAMASLALVYCVMVLIVGPWLWYEFDIWILLSLVSLVITYFFYRLAVNAAYQYGELVRSTFDLFRLDLMQALGLPRPANFFVEQKQWEEFSQLIVYGTSGNFELAPEGNK